jgi:hypothetical protein
MQVLPDATKGNPQIHNNPELLKAAEAAVKRMEEDPVTDVKAWANEIAEQFISGWL